MPGFEARHIADGSLFEEAVETEEVGVVEVGEFFYIF